MNIITMEHPTRILAFLISLVCYSSVSSHLPNLVIEPMVQHELNNRVGVKGAMGGNITLKSNSSIGNGNIGFVLAGEIEGGIPVAIKVIKKFHNNEYNSYVKIGATTDKTCEKYGIPFIYYAGEFLHLKTLAMTMLDIDLKSLNKQLDTFPKDSILIFNRDMIKTLKFIHSKGIIHHDIKPGNIMIRGADVFLCDFNLAEEKSTQKTRFKGGMRFKSITEHLGEPSSEIDDMQSLFYTMLSVAGVELPWANFETNREMLKYKLLFKDVEALCDQIKYPDLIEPYKKFYAEVIESMMQKRRPKYDYLYGLFNDALYDGRNRNERIVFEWLTPEAKAKARRGDILPIESIQFHKL